MHQYKARGGQPESALQKQIVQGLNLMVKGYFWRVRNGATFDPVRRQFRANTADPGIPDIHGWRDSGTHPRPVFIEVKYEAKVENRKTVLYAIKTTSEQKAWLERAFKSGCITGIAFTFDDALAIAQDDPKRYPRHPRTYGFMPKSWLEEYAKEYLENKKALAKERQDPLTRDIHYALPSREP